MQQEFVFPAADINGGTHSISFPFTSKQKLAHTAALMAAKKWCYQATQKFRPLEQCQTTINVKR